MVSRFYTRVQFLHVKMFKSLRYYHFKLKILMYSFI